MSDIQREVQSEADKMAQRIEQAIRSVMAKIQTQNPDLRQRLMQAFVKHLEATRGQDCGAVAIPDEMMNGMEEWLQKNNIPYFPIPTGDRENVILLSNENLRKVSDFKHALEQLSPKYTAWTQMHEFAKDTDAIGDRSVCVFDLGVSNEAIDPEIDEIRDEIIDKIHGNGNGYAAGYSSGIAGHDMNGDPVYERRVAVRLDAAMNADEQTPDLISVCAEVAVDQTNGIKTMVKSAAHATDDKNLDMFLRDIDMHTSGHLENAYSAEKKASLRYDEKTDRVLYMAPESTNERVLMDSDKLKELRTNPTWKKTIKSQLSHYTQSIDNMTHFTHDEKVIKDSRSAEELRDMEKAQAKILYDKLETIATTPTENGEIDYNAALSGDDFTTRPTFNSKAFQKIVRELEAKGHSIPEAISQAMLIDDFKDDVNKAVSSYVRQQSQVLSGYSPEGRIEKTIAEIRKDFGEENGVFKDLFARVKDLRIESAIPIIKDRLDAYMSKIKIKPVSALLAEENMRQETMMKENTRQSGRDVDMEPHLSNE